MSTHEEWPRMRGGRHLVMLAVILALAIALSFAWTTTVDADPGVTPVSPASVR